MIKEFSKYNFLDFIKSLNINYDDFKLSPDNFYHQSDIHGVNHVLRVMFNCLMIGNAIQDKVNTRRAFMAAYIHDMSRRGDGACPVHGRDAAIEKLPTYKNLFMKNGATEEDLKAIKLAVTNHSEKYEIEKDNPYYKAVAILRDADGLDLCRLGYEVRPDRLRFKESIGFIDTAEKLFNDTDWNHYDGFSDFLKENIGLKEGVRWYSKGKLVRDPNFVDKPKPDDFLNDDMFRNFLIDNGVYKEFIENCKDKKKLNFVADKDVIDNCLSWMDTPSGYEFWNRLDNRWKDIKTKLK